MALILRFPQELNGIFSVTLVIFSVCLCIFIYFYVFFVCYFCSFFQLSGHGKLAIKIWPFRLWQLIQEVVHPFSSIGICLPITDPFPMWTCWSNLIKKTIGDAQFHWAIDIGGMQNAQQWPRHISHNFKSASYYVKMCVGSENSQRPIGFTIKIKAYYVGWGAFFPWSPMIWVSKLLSHLHFCTSHHFGIYLVSAWHISRAQVRLCQR